MAKKPDFLKVVIEIIVKFFVTSNIEGVKKIRKISIPILCIILIGLLAIFAPDSLESVLQFLVSLF